MKKNLLPILIAIVIICIVLIVIILMNIKDKIIIDNDEKHTEYDEMAQVNDRDEYYMVKTILNKYFNTINLLDADLNNIGVIYETEEEKNKLTEEYTSLGIEGLERILDAEAMRALELNKDNIKESFIKYKNTYYLISEMYVVQKNINTNIYYIKGLLDYKTEFDLIIKTDSYTNTFSIYPPQYIELKNYNENSIENQFNITGIEYIEKNENNTYEKNIITDVTMAQYYLYDYGYLVNNYPEEAYKMLDEEYKNIRFPTFQDYKKYIGNTSKNYSLLQLKNYEVEKTEEYTIFKCTDKYGDIYIFKDIGIMNYKLQLDNYTIKDEDKYNILNKEQKVQYNIKQIISMLNMKDYQSIYNKLDENFKQNNFNTLNKLEEYLKANFYNHNKVVFKSYNKDIAPIYIYNVNIKNIENEEQNKDIKIIIKLLEGTDFIMSFEI